MSKMARDFEITTNHELYRTNWDHNLSVVLEELL